jgi:hypothetical protein
MAFVCKDPTDKRCSLKSTYLRGALVAAITLCNRRQTFCGTRVRNQRYFVAVGGTALVAPMNIASTEVLTNAAPESAFDDGFGDIEFGSEMTHLMGGGSAALRYDASLLGTGGTIAAGNAALA